MQYVKLGSTGLDVSRICLGCMSYGVPDRGAHPWTLDEEASRPFIQRRSRPASTSSTPPTCTPTARARRSSGARARRLRPARRGRDRDQGARPDAARPERRRAVAQGDHDRDRRTACAASAPTTSTSTRSIAGTTATPIEETLEALHDVVKAGKARYIGASSMYAWQFAKAQYIAERNGWTPLRHDAEPLQPALPRGGARDAAAVRRPGIGVIPWSPLARGRLTRDWDADDGAQRDRRVRQDALPATTTRRSSTRSREIAARARRAAGPRSPWRGCRATRPSTRRSSAPPSRVHLDDAVASLEIELTDDEVAELERPTPPRHRRLRLIRPPHRF